MVGDNSDAYAGVITDDHAWLSFGKVSGHVYNYIFDGSSFNFANQVSQNTSGIWSMSLTTDMQHLAVAAFSYVNVFDVSMGVNTVDFSLFNSLNFTHSDFRNVKLTDDFMYLLVANGLNNDSFVYRNNGSGFEKQS